MSTFNCKNFRAHHLRADKCRNCFGDRSRHQLSEQPATSESPTKQQQQQQQNVSPDNELTREQLIDELRNCGQQLQDRSKCLAESQQLVEKLKKDIETLKLEGGKATDSKRCDECPKLSAELERLRKDIAKLEKERDEAREELRNLEREMEELQDNFKEEESEQFELVKQELDSALKNCKILQIRLNKADRQYSQLEQVKSLLERQLEESTSKRQTEATSQTGVGFVQLGPDSVKLATSEYDQLLRDLNDTIEREKDLQEQIKYSEEEAQLKSERLQAVEAENEVLLSRVNKLTLTNSRLRSNSLRGSPSGEHPSASSESNSSQLIEQNEQLKLALELAQSECERLKAKLQVSQSSLEAREVSLKDSESKRAKAEAETRIRVSRLKNTQEIGSSNATVSSQDSTDQAELNRLELECRQMRTRLVHSERESKQLKAQLELSASSGRQPRTSEHSAQRISSSQSFDSASVEQAATRELNRKLRDQCDQLASQKAQLEHKLEQLAIDKNVGSTLMESDLLEKLKRQLDSSESELAKARSRLVELDLDNNRLQRQYRRLIESLETGGGGGGGECELVRRVKLPSEAQRDAMTRQELRQALKEIEAELDETLAKLRAKNCLIREQQSSQQRQANELGGDQTKVLLQQPAQQQQQSQSRSNSPSSPNPEEQLKSLRRLLDQERLLSNNLKIDVSNLEQSRQELLTTNRMYERERGAIEEEVDKLRQVNGELNVDLEEVRKAHRTVSLRWKELQVVHEKLRNELAQQRALSQQHQAEAEEHQESGAKSANGSSGDLLLMARDLSELKVKNGFLMRQLEIAREDSARQLDDLRQVSEAQQRRAVELAQLELKERHLAEGQQIREELNDLKQKLALSQRQVARHEEEMTGERDRLRSMERDWRRDKSQWQQRMEQSEAQLAIERRSNEFKVKEFEAQVREKERQLIGVQDRYVQLERDLQRTQNKYKLLEENSESKLKSLTRELEAKKRELGELVTRSQSREDEYYENCKRFNSEKATLTEALESIKRSYDEKLAEVKSARELLSLRQDQAYKERNNGQERIDSLTAQLIRMGEHEAQARLLKQQVQALERQLESARRDSAQLKEDRNRLKARADELEKRVAQYEKQELITKTSSISSSGTNLLFGRKSFSSSSSSSSKKSELKAGTKLEATASPTEVDGGDKEAAGERLRSNALMVERLSSKINDQRHLINMLKQQHDETQLELKQLKLVQSVERNKWQTRLAQLTSQLNECEEKLLFESAFLSPETFENARRKLEVKWSEERRSASELLRQQQAQSDGLMRDLKKLNQAHDLLRLHSKQLESHNNKLSRKLIEYQQQQTSFVDTRRIDLASDRKLENCLAEKQELLSKQAKLQRTNARLLRVMRQEVQPLVETVAKIVTALDQGDSASKTTEGETRATPTSAASDADSRSSTKRPLVTAGSAPRLSEDSGASETIATARPAHQAQTQQPSRLSRLLLGKQTTTTTDAPATGNSPTSDQPIVAAKATTKTVKRVKVKAASLGITTSEKKQLKRHLQELSGALEDFGGDEVSSGSQIERVADRNPLVSSTVESPDMRLRASSEAPAATDPKLEGRQTRALSQSLQRPAIHSHLRQQQQLQPQSDSESPGTTTCGRVRWQLDNSDLDSERSWSASQLDSPAATSSDAYRRFPRATPSAGCHASLTDCGSESSLASDFSSPAAFGTTSRRFVSGTESDSCVVGSSSSAAAANSRKLKSTNRKGLKTRLTNTWRNISRSITALATSDSEADCEPSLERQQESKSGGALREARV